MLATGACLLIARQVDADILNAASASFADVNAAINSASDGDTVVVPAGQASWTKALVITKGIILRGANIDAGSDLTVILDDVPRSGPHQAVIEVKSLNRTQSFRLTGFTFKSDTVTKIVNNGAVIVTGTCPSVRIDHCHFDKLYANPALAIFGWCYGVVDHCVFDVRPNIGVESMWVIHDTWAGYSNGDGSWAEPAYFGSDKFIFIEDCTFTCNGFGGAFDCYYGSRFVFRHNNCTNVTPVVHGTESGGRKRGGRAAEIYNNTFNWTRSPAKAGQLRSGSLVTHDNTWTGTSIPNGMTLTAYRDFYPFAPWGGANGNNGWDSNDSHGLYANGTHTGSNSSSTLTDSSANWTPNQWVGYSITNTTQTVSYVFAGATHHYNQASYITANTATTITFLAHNGGFGPSMNFNTGDGYSICKVLVCLDQPGRGGGDLLKGFTSPVNSRTGTASWPRQALEPCYSWNNTRSADGSKVNLSSSEPTIQENRDFYNNTPMPGYTPYKYPHPLVSGGGGGGHSTAAQSAWKKKPGSKSHRPKVTAKHLPVKTGKKAQIEKRKREVSSSMEARPAP